MLDYEADKEVPIILGRPFLATGRTLIDVQKGELTMRVHDEQVTFNVFKAMQFPDDVEECAAMSVFDAVVDEEIQEEFCKSASQMFLSGNCDEDGGKEEAQVTWLGKKHQGDNGKRPFESLELTEGVFKWVKPSIEEAPVLDLKPLPAHLRYAYLGEGSTLPVIISSTLDLKQEQLLLEMLKNYKRAIGWIIADIKGISPSVCMHKILLEDCCSNSVEQQRRLNPIMKEVVKKEVIKWLDAGIIYPISDSSWVSPVQCVPKKGGVTVVANDNNELIPT